MAELTADAQYVLDDIKANGEAIATYYFGVRSLDAIYGHLKLNGAAAMKLALVTRELLDKGYVHIWKTGEITLTSKVIPNAPAATEATHPDHPKEQG